MWIIRTSSAGVRRRFSRTRHVPLKNSTANFRCCAFSPVNRRAMRTPARRNGVEDIAFPLRSFDPASPIAADSFRDASREERNLLRRFTPRFDYEIPVRAVQLPAAIGKALRREMSEG